MIDGRRNIVLTGFMGTGKTTVGRRLAARLGYRFVDTDRIIEQRHGSIESVFEHRGESGFRAMERTVAAQLADRRGLVIATGGRMMLDEANISTLGTEADVICLVADPDTIHRRLVVDDSGVVRPLLAGDDPRARIVELLACREAGYRKFTQVDTTDLDPDQVVDAILAVVDGSVFGLRRPKQRNGH